MNVGSLFSGIGGIDLGLERAGMRVLWQVECDPYARAVLRKHWPTAALYDDVRSVGASNLAPVDLVCGGFPCQDVSWSGAGVGLEGARSGLWSEYARIIRELRPRYVLVENVAALLERGMGRVVGDLAACGYDAEWDCFPAASFGAPHERDRVFLLATDANAQHGNSRVGILADHEAAVRAEEDRNRASVWVAPPCVPSRVGHGVACWVDRRERTEVIGNAVVPQVAEWIGRQILAHAEEAVIAPRQLPLSVPGNGGEGA